MKNLRFHFQLLFFQNFVTKFLSWFKMLSNVSRLAALGAVYLSSTSNSLLAYKPLNHSLLTPK